MLRYLYIYIYIYIYIYKYIFIQLPAKSKIIYEQLELANNIACNAIPTSIEIISHRKQ